MPSTRSLKVIEQKIKKLQAQARDIKQSQRDGIEQLRAIIEKYELLPVHVKKAMRSNSSQRGLRTRSESSVSPKYRSPYNAAIVWSGRGRRPSWLVAALKSGRTIDEFLIRDTQDATSDRPSAEIVLAKTFSGNRDASQDRQGEDGPQATSS